MRSFKKAIGLGILVWLVPFVVAVLVFPFHDSWRSLFESIMAVTVAATAVFFGWLYLRSFEAIRVQDGLILGVFWWILCVAIDLPLVTAGPMEMTVMEYFADIGLTYVSIPVITAGLAKASR